MSEVKLLTRIWAACACLAVVSLLVSRTADAQTTYTVTDLGKLPGASTSYGMAINASGTIVGSSGPVLDGTEPSHPFVWENGVMGDLGSLAAHGSIVGLGINDSGVVVGRTTDGFVDNVAFRHTAGGYVLLDGLRAGAYDINNFGQVAGTAQNDFGLYRARVWSGDGGYVILGTLLGQWGATSGALAINDAGYAVGSSLDMRTGGWTRHGFTWDGYTLSDLGVFGSYNSSEATAISESGFVVGTVGTGLTLDGTAHAFRYDGLFVDGGGFVDLGALAGGYSRAYGVNSAGTVVGTSSSEFGDHAFIWTQPGAMVDLNSVANTNGGWILSEARAINEAGLITGTGSLNGETHAFLLTPMDVSAVPEPGACALLILGGFAAIVSFSHRRRCRY